MRIRFCFLTLTLLASLPAGTTLLADPPPPPWPDGNAIVKDLSSSDPKSVAAGMKEIDGEFQRDVGRAMGDLRGPFITALMNSKHFAEADQLALKGIIATPQDLGSDQMLLNIRVQALLALDKPDQALQEAKALYNVSTMNDLPGAMLLVAQCLNAAHPKDLNWAERFRQEQVAGAIFDGQIVTQINGDPNRPPVLSPAPTVTPATQPNLDAATVLLSIKMQDSAYSTAVEHWFGEDYGGLVGKGNLLLMADRAADAKIVFDRAYALGAQPNLADASENIARCMKAEDGSVGRANSWILSLRPTVANRMGGSSETEVRWTRRIFPAPIQGVGRGEGRATPECACASWSAAQSARKPVAAISARLDPHPAISLEGRGRRFAPPRFLFIILLSNLLPCARGFADPPPDPAHDQPRIMAAISSPDKKKVHAEIAELMTTLQTDPGFVVNMMRGPVLRTLIDHGYFQDAADLVPKIIVWNLQDLGCVQQLQQYRVEALTKAHKPKEALAAAKSLYDVCSLHDSENMLIALAEAINAAHPTDPSAAEQLVKEEMAGAVAKDEWSAIRSPYERSLPGDSAYRDQAAKEQPGAYLIPVNEWGAVFRQLNLLLLADEPDAAMKLLTSVPRPDQPWNPREVDEAMARVMRAKDGTIGRANAFIRARNKQYAAQ